MRFIVGIPHSSMLDSKWVSKMFTSWSAFILPSTSASCPTPSHPIQPHTMIFPPPNLTVLWISLSISPSPTCFCTHYFPSDPSLLIFSLIRPNNSLPVLHTSFLVLQSKGQVLLPVHCSKQWPFLLCHSLEWVSLENIPDCLWGNWIGDDGVNVFGGQDSIGSLASGDLGDDWVLRMSRVLWWVTSMQDLSIREEVLKYPGHNRLANFLLIRGDGVHDEL